MSNFTPRQFRDACGQFGTGVTVVATRVAGEDYGMTANAFMSVSLEPPLIAISIGATARMHARLVATKRFGLSVLAQDMDAIAWHFAGRPLAEPANVFEHRNDVPIIRRAVASFVASVEQIVLPA